MDQKDLAFVFLSLIIVYGVAFSTAIEAIENHENTSNHPNNPPSDNNNSENNTNQLHIVYNLLSNLPNINSETMNSESKPSTTESPAVSPSLSNPSSTESTATTINNSNTISPQIRIDSSNTYTHTPYQMFTINEHEDNDDDEFETDYRYSIGIGNPLLLIDSQSSNDILDDASLLITTVDGNFSVLSASYGSKQMDLDSSSNEPLYQSPDIKYENKLNQVIPGINGELYLLHSYIDDHMHEEYLEPLPFTIEQIAKNTGYADSYNTWYLVDPKNTVFWINIDKWNVCSEIENDITCNIPLCNDALIVTRIDRQITAVNVNNEKPYTKWRFKHGEYRVATKHNNNKPLADINRFELWQSLDDDSKYTIFLYDRDRDVIKWSKSFSSIVTHVQLLTYDHQIYNMYVYHTKNVKEFNSNDNYGLWIVPSDKYTQIAIAHSNRNPISNHMFLPQSNTYKNDINDINDDDIRIIDEDNPDIDIDYELKQKYHKPIDKKLNKIRFVHLSFDGDLDKQTNIPTPATEFIQHNNDIPSWQKGLQITNNAQKYAQASALKIFNPKGLLSMEHTHSNNNINTNNNNNNNNGIEHYYYPKNLLTLSFFIATLFIYLTPLRFGIKKLLSRSQRSQPHIDAANLPILPVIPVNNRLNNRSNKLSKRIEEDIKIIGKFKYNVKMKLGCGRRGHVFCGTFENRAVAIKRIDKISNNCVDNEIDILLKVDHQSNIVRYYAKESDNEFDYIALELCLCSLYDIIKCKNNTKKSMFIGRKIPKIDGILKPIVTYEININSLSINGKHTTFCSCEQCRINNKKIISKYRPNNYKPLTNIHNKHLISHDHDWGNNINNINETIDINKHFKKPKLKRHKFVSNNAKKMCLEMIEGLIALHTARHGCIIHRDIKPQNILIGNNYQCKLADMGMAKLMDPSKISFDSESVGTLFWNAPELIYHKSMSKLPFINTNKIITCKTNQIGMKQEYKYEIGNDLQSIFGPPKYINNLIENEYETETDSEYETETENENEESISYNYSSTEEKFEDTNEWISSSLTRAVDIFSLGCVFSFLLSNGHHPYGDRLIDQHENMRQQKPNLKYCQYCVPEAYDLISWMININPKQRPQVIQCKNHPFFWSDEMIILFLNATSDYIEKCNKSNELRIILELASQQIIGNDWGLFIDYDVLNDAGKHRKYNFKSMRDYLRLIRNKWNHFSELSLKLREKLCEKDNTNIKSASKFLHYFTQYTPELVMYCYKLIASEIKTTNETHIKTFKKYYNEISDNRIILFQQQVRGNKFRRWYNKH